MPSSTINKVIPWALDFALGSVSATTTTASANIPLVIKVLLPLSIKSSPSLTALVRIPCRSDPASGIYKEKFKCIIANCLLRFLLFTKVYTSAKNFSLYFHCIMQAGEYRWRQKRKPAAYEKRQ